VSPVYCAQADLHCSLCGAQFDMGEAMEWHGDGMIHPRCLPRDAA
jgi:hypothetical protein